MGNLWEHRECIVLYWNRAQTVFGVKVEKIGDQLIVLDSAVSSEDMDSFSLAVAEVMGVLETSESHLMLAGGYMSGTLIFDVTLPKMSIQDTRQAVIYELPRHVPCDPQELIFGFRILPSQEEDDNSGKNIVRIIAIKKNNWNEIIADLSGAGVRIDAVLHPYLLIDPLLGEESDVLFYDDGKSVSCASSPEYHGRKIVLHDSDEDISETVFGNSLRYFEELHYDKDSLPSTVSEDPVSFFPSLLMAAYGMSPEYGNDRNSIMKLPSSLLPERYRTLRASFFGLVATILFLFLILIGRFWWDAKERYHKITKEIRNIKQMQINTENQKKALLDKAEILTEIMDKQKGIPEVATCLRTLSMILSKDMCLGSFASRDDAVDISIRYTKPGLTVPDLNNTKVMKVITSSTRKNSRDNSTNVYVRLSYLPPEKRNGKK